MTQLLIDRAMLEQLVVALNNAEAALNNSQALIAGRERFGFAKTCYGVNEIALGFVSPAIAAGRAALANAVPTVWQKIETAPKPNEEVIVWPYPSHNCMTAQINTTGAWTYSEYENDFGWNESVCYPP